MPNGFLKEECVIFDNMLEGYDDALVASRAAVVTKFDQLQMERTGDIMWLPQPYIMTTYAGNDATSNFKDVTQLSVPAVINTQRHAPWVMTARELRDGQQETRLSKAAYQRLSADMNVDVMTVASLFGTLVNKRNVAATGFDDIQLADALFTEQGIPREDRKFLASPRDYNNMAADLAKVKTSSAAAALTAYEKAIVPDIAGFDLYKMDYAYRLTAAAGVTVTLNGANQFYTPAAATLTAGRGSLNVDNRFQTITISVASGTVKVGDAFTIAGVNACHHITKQDTGQLKTFRITAILTGAGGSGTVQITPPIISNGGATNAEAMYQNVTATPANGAAITFLNTVTASVNPFWQGDAVQILPGRLAPAPDSGLAVMRGATDQGFELVMTRQGGINDLSTKYRVDALWGTVAAQPEMMGITLFGQT
jgi:hypothetical protein